MGPARAGRNSPPKVCRDLWIVGGAVRLIAQATLGPLSIDGGCSTGNLDEAVLMADMIHRATKVAVLADSSKFGHSLFA